MKSILLVVFAALGLAGTANAVPILSVTGATSPLSPAFDATNSPGAAGSGFSVGSDMNNLSFSIEYTCAGACLIDAYLVNDIGPGTSLSNVISSTTLDGSSATAFTGINLLAGTYALILSSNAGIWSWDASASPSVFSNGITPINSLVSTAFDSILPYASSFGELTDLAFLYSIDQASTAPPPTPVPLGSTLPLMTAGLLPLIVLHRRKRIGC